MYAIQQKFVCDIDRFEDIISASLSTALHTHPVCLMSEWNVFFKKTNLVCVQTIHCQRGLPRFLSLPQTHHLPSAFPPYCICLWPRHWLGRLIRETKQSHLVSQALHCPCTKQQTRGNYPVPVPVPQVLSPNPFLSLLEDLTGHGFYKQNTHTIAFLGFKICCLVQFYCFCFSQGPLFHIGWRFSRKLLRSSSSVGASSLSWLLFSTGSSVAKLFLTQGTKCQESNRFLWWKCCEMSLFFFFGCDHCVGGVRAGRRTPRCGFCLQPRDFAYQVRRRVLLGNMLCKQPGIY